MLKEAAADYCMFFCRGGLEPGWREREGERESRHEISDGEDKDVRESLKVKQKQH